MNTHLDHTDIQDHVDGVLSDTERTAVEAHLATCSACRNSIDTAQRLRAQLAALPRDLPPPPHLLEQVHARIAGSPAPMAAAWYARPLLLAAAALLLIALSSTVTALLLGQRRPDAPSLTTAATDAATAIVAVHALERSYEDAIAELQRAVAEQQHELAPETLRVLRTNLDLIDKAVAEARAALHADPSNDVLAELLRSGYERKLDVLRSVSSHARGRT